jgi:hypothetical protein
VACEKGETYLLFSKFQVNFSFWTVNVRWPADVLSSTTPEITDQIHELILEDRRISSKSIAEQLGISRERVGSIIREDLDMLVAFFTFLVGLRTYQHPWYTRKYISSFAAYKNRIAKQRPNFQEG